MLLNFLEAAALLLAPAVRHFLGEGPVDKAVELIDIRRVNALIEPLVFGLVAADYLGMLAPFVGVAGVQGLANPFQYFVIEVQPAEQLGKLRLECLFADVFAGAIRRVALGLIRITGAMVIDVASLFDLTNHRTAAMGTRNEAREGEVVPTTKLFCGSSDGVAICVSLRSLQLALGKVKLYVVTYDNPGTELRTPNALGLATKKRLMFEYEREVRAIATTETSDPKLTKGEFGFTYDIDPESLINSIAVDPEADITLMEAVVRAVDDYAPKLRDKVTWSAMREPPPLFKK